MTQLAYFNFRLIIAGMLMVIGSTLFLGVIPGKLRGTIFDSSRKCIGLAMLIMPLSTFTVYFLSLRFHEHDLYVVSYLTACYIISIMVTVGFVPLLGGKFDYRQWRFIRGLISIPFFTMPMIGAYLYGDEQIVFFAKILTIVLLLLTIAYQSYIFSKLYRRAVKRGNNYYSDDVEVDIRWVIKSVAAFFTLEIVCAISPLYASMGFVLEFVLTIYRVATIAYVFSRFIDFMKNFEKKMSVCDRLRIDSEELEQEESYYKNLTPEQQLSIRTRLDSWVAKRGYTLNGVTIDDVAIEAVTNRTYLSIYINRNFGCSFKVWITSLRIELAKELLMGNDTILDVSRSVGFSSPQSFMHSFKRDVGLTPTQWRNRY